MTRYDRVETALAKAGDKMDEVWLWCLHCQRFFQAKDLKLDALGSWQRCPFDDCRASGFDIIILYWTCDRGVHPDWPQSEAELTFGRCTAPPPLDTAPPAPTRRHSGRP